MVEKDEILDNADLIREARKRTREHSAGRVVRTAGVAPDVEAKLNAIPGYRVKLISYRSTHVLESAEGVRAPFNRSHASELARLMRERAEEPARD